MRQCLWICMGKVNHSEDVGSQMFMGTSRRHPKPHSGYFHCGFGEENFLVWLTKLNQKYLTISCAIDPLIVWWSLWNSSQLFAQLLLLYLSVAILSLSLLHSFPLSCSHRKNFPNFKTTSFTCNLDPSFSHLLSEFNPVITSPSFLYFSLFLSTSFFPIIV